MEEKFSNNCLKENINSNERIFFEDFESFLDSDTFTEKFSLWENTLQIQHNIGMYLEIGTHPKKEIIRLQDMLELLWYFPKDEQYFTGRDIQGADYQSPYERFDMIGWHFGEQTRNAVREFQTQENIDEDGIVGPKTKKRFYQRIYERFYSAKNKNCILKDSRVKREWILE